MKVILSLLLISAFITFSKAVKQCQPFEVFADCTFSCGDDCSSLNPGCIDVCNEGKCVCEPGRKRLNGICVPLEDCPK